MKLHEPSLCKTILVSGFFVCALHLLPTSALPVAAANSSDRVQGLSPNPLHLAQQRQCSRRVGPVASQNTAWQKWREAKRQGYAVSNGVVPCTDQHGTRGYCFNVFFSC
jgi:hypothetical protein